MRDQIVQALLAIKPHDPEEEKSIGSAISWIQSGAELFRSAKPTRKLKEELEIEANLLSQDPFFLTITKVSKTPALTDVSFWYVSKNNEFDCSWFDCREFEAIKWFNLQAVFSLKKNRNMARFIANFTQAELS